MPDLAQYLQDSSTLIGAVVAALPFVMAYVRRGIKTLRILVKAGREALDVAGDAVDDIADVWEGDWEPTPGMGD